MSKYPEWWSERQDAYEFLINAEAAGAPEWLIKDFVIAEGLTLLSGAPKLGFKTFMAFAMMVALNTGKKFMGFSPPHGAQKVMFIEAEGGTSTTARRFRSFAAGSGISAEELFKGIVWVHRPTDFLLNTEKTFHDVSRIILENEIKVIFLDTLNMLSGCDENSSTEMGQVMRNLKKWTKLGVSVVMLHHVNKGAGADWKTPADLSIRGSSAITGAYDVHIHVRNPDINKPQEFVWEVSSKDQERLYFKGMWWLESLDTQEGRKLQKTFVDFEEIPSLEAASERDLDELVLMLEPGRTFLVTELKDLWNIPLGSAKKIVKKLVEEGTFVEHGRKYYYGGLND